jgi:hypothetical protein
MKWRRSLVIAARLQDGDDHQVGVGEEPLFGFDAGGFRGAGDGAEVFVPGQTAQMIRADPGQSYDFVFGEDFLAGFNAHHGFAPVLRCPAPN